MEDLKLKLIQSIIKTNDLRILNQIKNILSGNSFPENRNVVAEEQAVYQSEKPMTDEEVEEYFKEEKIELPDYMMKMIERGMDDVKNGRVYTEEEMDKMDEKEVVELPIEILEILKMSEEDVKAGRVHTNEEIETYFDEWLKK